MLPAATAGCTSRSSTSGRATRRWCGFRAARRCSSTPAGCPAAAPSTSAIASSRRCCASAGVRRLGTIALTHGDADHIGGAPSAVLEFRPWEVWEGIPVPPFGRCSAIRRSGRVGRAASGATFRPAMSTSDRRGVGRGQASRGLPDWERQDVRNDDSIVLELLWRDVSIVLTGDIGAEVERADRAALRPRPAARRQGPASRQPDVELARRSSARSRPASPSSASDAAITSVTPPPAVLRALPARPGPRCSAPTRTAPSRSIRTAHRSTFTRSPVAHDHVFSSTKTRTTTKDTKDTKGTKTTDGHMLRVPTPLPDDLEASRVDGSIGCLYRRFTASLVQDCWRASTREPSPRSLNCRGDLVRARTVASGQLSRAVHLPPSTRSLGRRARWWWRSRRSSDCCRCTSRR